MANEGLIRFTPNSKLMEEDASKRATAAILQEADNKRTSIESSLAQYIRSAWERARLSKLTLKNRMLKNLRQYKGEYDADKLSAIREMGGSEAFIPLTNIKCRAGNAWMEEVLFQPAEIPWDVEPTPIPELPEEVKMEIIGQLMSVYEQMAMSSAMATGQSPQDFMRESLMSIGSQMKEEIRLKIEDAAKEAAERMKDKIQDQFIEGSFYQALDDVLSDIAIYPTAFLKGPVFRKSKKISIVNGVPMIDEVLMPLYERRSPFDIYPAPDASSINDGYLIDKISISPKDLHGLIGLDGFKEDAIRQVIDLYDRGGLKEWAETDYERQSLENKPFSSSYDSDRIDVLEFWGSVRGKLLLEWGMDAMDVPDPDDFYDICAWLIGDIVIKSMLNYDPTGKKPYARASFIEIPDSIWGVSIPDVLESLQTACNAISRAIINNSAISSGPLVERNIDRIPSYEPKVIYPWKMFDSTDTQMNGAPAYKFYQPDMVSDRLMVVLQAFLKQADETSGIPAYAHGDVTVSGAGRTASGLSMLTSNANRGIKAVIKNIDRMIEDVVSRQYYINLITGEFGGPVPDVKVFAKGSAVLLEKDLQSVRRTEFLQATTNPYDLNIIGVEGRKFLLEEVAKAHGIDVHKLFSGSIDALPMIPPQESAQQMPSQGSPPKPKTLDASGQPASATDRQQFLGENGR